MARDGISHNQRQSQVWAGYRAARDGHLVRGRASKSTSSRGGTARESRGTQKPYAPAKFCSMETQYFAKTGDGTLGISFLGTRRSFSAMTSPSANRTSFRACNLPQSCSHIKLTTVVTLTLSWPLVRVIAIRCASLSVVIPTLAAAPHSPMSP